MTRIRYVPECEDCGSEHLGRCGSLSFAERIRTVQVPASVTPSRTLKRYFDTSSIDDQLGGTAKDRKARFEHDTNGMGAVKPNKDGRLYAKDRKSREVRALSEKETANYLGTSLSDA